MLVAIFRANASSPFVRIYLFLVISHHVVYVFFVRRSDTSSHRAEKCMSFLIKERLHAPEGSDMFTLSETAPLLPVINKKTAEINDFSGLSGAYGIRTHGLLNAIRFEAITRFKTGGFFHFFAYFTAICLNFIRRITSSVVEILPVVDLTVNN